MSNVEDIVNKFKTEYEEGFTGNEIQKILKLFPDINITKFYDTIDFITGLMKDGRFITYKIDIIHALNCGIENRDLTLNEFD